MNKELLAAAAVVLGAHALTYFLVNLLPDATLIALGLESANQQVFANLQAEVVRRPYLDTIFGLLQFDFGQTLDRVPVSEELGRALALSAPRIAGAFGLVCAAAFIAAFTRRLPRALVSFLSFLPPYVSAFFALLILLAAGAASPGDPALGVFCTLAVAISPAMLVVEQVAGITKRNLATEFARTLVSIAANDRFLRGSKISTSTCRIVIVRETPGKYFNPVIVYLSLLTAVAIRPLSR